jgi:hypothetical protein
MKDCINIKKKELNSSETSCERGKEVKLEINETLGINNFVF